MGELCKDNDVIVDLALIRTNNVDIKGQLDLIYHELLLMSQAIGQDYIDNFDSLDLNEHVDKNLVGSLHEKHRNKQWVLYKYDKTEEQCVQENVMLTLTEAVKKYQENNLHIELSKEEGQPPVGDVGIVVSN